MVGTKPMLFPAATRSLLHAFISATELMVSINAFPNKKAFRRGRLHSIRLFLPFRPGLVDPGGMFQDRTKVPGLLLRLQTGTHYRQKESTIKRKIRYKKIFTRENAE